MHDTHDTDPQLSRRSLIQGATLGAVATSMATGGTALAQGAPRAVSGGRFAGKVALITGGARGQGRAHAELLAREGADIVLCDILAPVGTLDYPLASQADMDRTVALVRALGRRCLAIKADMRDAAAATDVVRRATAELGKVDLLIANAGIYGTSPLAQMSDQAFDDVIQTNLYGVFHIVRAVLPGMQQRKYGRIVATASMAGRMGIANAAHYSASKWGVIGMVKAVALEVAKQGITVNAVCPTGVNTPLINNEAAWRRALPGDPAPTQAKFEAKMRANPYSPQGVPWVESDDVARATAFLLSDDARHITGTAIDIAAGGSAQTSA